MLSSAKGKIKQTLGHKTDHLFADISNQILLMNKLIQL